MDKTQRLSIKMMLLFGSENAHAMRRAWGCHGAVMLAGFNETTQPIKGVVNFVVFKADGSQLMYKHIVCGAGLWVVISLKEINQNVEHRISRRLSSNYVQDRKSTRLNSSHV